MGTLEKADTHASLTLIITHITPIFMINICGYFFNSESFRSKFIFAPYETLHRIMQYMQRLKREKQFYHYFAKTKFKNNFSTEKEFAEFIKLFSKFYNLASRNMNLSEHKFSFHDNKEVLMISQDTV